MQKIIAGLVTIVLLTACTAAGMAEDVALLEIFPWQSYHLAGGTNIDIPQILGADNEAIASINAQLGVIFEEYSAFVDSPSDDSWCEVGYSVIESDPYLTIVLTACAYPTYGTDGDIYSFVYEAQQGRALSTVEGLELVGIGLDTIVQDFTGYLEAEQMNRFLVSIDVVGFGVEQGGEIVFFIEADVGMTDAENWKGHYVWKDGAIEDYSAYIYNPTTDSMVLYPDGTVFLLDTFFAGDATADMYPTVLSELTGLNFDCTISAVEGGYLIDWSADSTLIAGLGDTQMREDFFFYDVDTLSWFMLDTMHLTMLANFDIEYVYYSMTGGNELVLPDVWNSPVIPLDSPYLGSSFYATDTTIME